MLVGTDTSTVDSQVMSTTENDNDIRNKWIFGSFNWFSNYQTKVSTYFYIGMQNDSSPAETSMNSYFREYSMSKNISIASPFPKFSLTDAYFYFDSVGLATGYTSVGIKYQNFIFSNHASDDKPYLRKRIFSPTS